MEYNIMKEYEVVQIEDGVSTFTGAKTEVTLTKKEVLAAVKYDNIQRKLKMADDAWLMDYLERILESEESADKLIKSWFDGCRFKKDFAKEVRDWLIEAIENKAVTSV